MRVPVALALSGLAMTLGACAGGDGGDGDGDGGESGGDEVLPDVPEPTPAVCPDFELGAVSTAMATGDTTGAPALRHGDCGGRGAPEHVYGWTVPAPGIYEVWVEADFDAVLSVLQGGCDGAFVLCSDDNAGKDFAPRVYVNAMEGGADYALVVDGHGDGRRFFGEYTLHVAPFEFATCPTEDLGTAFPVTRTFDSGVSLVDTAPVCGGNRPEALFAWTAPADGLYRIDLTGEQVLRPRLTVSDTVCGDGDVAHCSQGPYVASLSGGETLALGANQFGPFDGPLTLAISEYTCTATDLGVALPATASDTIDPARADLAANCGGAGGEVIFTWTAPQDGDYRFSTAGSGGDTVLHVREGDDCAGPVLVCADDGAEGTSQAADATLSLMGGQAVSVVVDSLLPNTSFDVDLTIEVAP